MNTKVGVVCVFVVVCVSAALGDDVDCEKHPEPLDPRTCCPVPDFVTDDVKEKCQEYEEELPMPGGEAGKDGDATDKPKPHPHPNPRFRPPHHPCFMSCLLNETGILVDDQVNEANLEEYLRDALSEAPDMIPILEAGFKTCSTKRDEMRAKWEEHMKNNPEMARHHHHHHHRCTPTGTMLLGCVFMESFNNCAPSIWSNTQQCNDWRSFMMNCKPPRGPWGKHGKPMNSGKDVESDE